MAVVVSGQTWRAPGYGQAIRLGEASSDGFHRSWIMLFPEGEYEHPQYGDLKFSRSRLSEIKQLFDERVRHIDIALDANHDQDKATGWLEQLQLREANADGAPAGLWGLVRWTPYGVQLLKDQLYRYFSPEFGPWTDPASGRKYQNVLIGGGLTNRPFLKEMPAVALAEISQRSWASVDKSCLPAACFLIIGDRGKKSTWRLPVYEGAGPKDADGCYTRRGALNINGVRAALAALGGARSGKPMTGVPSGVRAKLEGWLKRYGANKSDKTARTAQAEKTQQASEPADGGEVVEETMPKLKSQRGQSLEFDEETQSFDDGGDDDAAMSEDDESSTETYDDGEPDGDEEDGKVDPKSDTHGAFDGRHQHGKFAMHEHDGDGDHSDARLKDARGGKKMSDRMSDHGHSHDEDEQSLSLAEMREAYSEQNRQLAEMREQLYRRDVADTLSAWDAGKFLFSEAPRNKATGKALPMVAMSKRFRDQYSAFMLNEGAGLSREVRQQINSLLEVGLSAAVVDLSNRGASFDQEKRRTVRGGQQGQRAEVGAEVAELSEKLATESGKRFDQLSYEDRLRLLMNAERELGSNGLPY